VILQVHSLDDPRVSAYRHVGDHSWLRSRNLFVAEGRLVLLRLLAAGLQIDSVLLSPAALEALRAALEPLKQPVYVAGQPVLDGIAGFNFHRGCLALARRPAPADPLRLARAQLLLGLEGIGNPDNVGGLFRTAAAFGVDAVLIDDATSDPFYRKAVRTSMGAVLRVPFDVAQNWHDRCASLRQQGFSVVALATETDAIALDEFASGVRAGDRLLVLVGAEGAGLSRRSRQEADVRVRIPMAHGIDSLNVTVAAGIALSRLARRTGRRFDGSGPDSIIDPGAE
jgi:tRNA G18 (ribose-2'-O)-methylase SpoU